MFSILKTIMSSLFKKSATVAYPFAPKENHPLVRGHIEVDIDACIFCGICRRKCPTEAIDVKKDEKTWAIEPFKCIVCNCCVESCPKKCLYMKSGMTPVSTEKTKEVVGYARVSTDSADNSNG